MITLHYLFEPLSGACHGASPLILAAREVTGIRLELHCRGPEAGAGSEDLARWRETAPAQDQRMARLSRQPFGEAYFAAILGDAQVCPQPLPPAVAILAAGQAAGRDLAFLLQLQQAYFGEGRRVWEIEELNAIAQALLLDLPAFGAACASVREGEAARHFARTLEWFGRAAAKACPAVVLERPDGLVVPINVNAWLGQPADFAAALAKIALTTPQA